VTAPDEPLQLIRALFTRSTSALWATTYNVDLRLVNEFLLPALGAPPLNVTVLADGRRLDRSLARVGADTDRLAWVNRRWLLRGVHPPGPTFHPKSYLGVAGRHATLLVGSGNLSVPGLDEGREVFTTFRSGTPAGDRAIAIWRGWMRRLVAWSDDPLLVERFTDLEGRLPPPVRDAPDFGNPVLLHNLDIALATQLAMFLPGDGVDELHLCAPFYDRDLAAVAGLLHDLQPRAVTVYVGATTNVDGPALRRSLMGLRVRYRGFEPDEFTHAKIVGVVDGDRGWLLTGSANLSRSALLHPGSGRGNVELAVLSTTTAADVRAAFAPPEARIVDRAASDLDALSFTEHEEPAQTRVRLIRAEALDDSRVRVVSEPDADPSWLLADPAERHHLACDTEGRASTVTPVRDRLVRLVDAAGSELSNSVVVDDATGLTATLGDAGSQHRERPPELSLSDLDTVLGRALATLNRELVMDVSEAAADQQSGTGGHDTADETADDDFWERLLHEQLAADPRAVRYREWRTGGRDALRQLLQSLLTPPPGNPRGSGIGADGDVVLPGEPGRAWSVPTRLRVRIRNVLRRWATAQADPRLVWFDPGAPVINFTAIVYFLGSLRLAAVDTPEEVALSDVDLDLLWWEWLATFVGTGRGDGYLDRLSDDTDADDVVRDLDPQVRETTAWLCWLTIRPSQSQRSRIIKVQPVLQAAVDRGLPEPTEESARSARAVAGRPVTPADIETDLLAAAVFVDDDLWCDTTKQELELAELRFGRRQELHGVDALLHVAGMPDPLHDVRLTRLLEAVARYRGCRTVAVYAVGRSVGRTRPGLEVGADWRVIFRQGEPITYFRSRYADEIESPVSVDRALLQRLNETGTPLAATFQRPRTF
jgi:hypothetical protein